MSTTGPAACMNCSRLVGDGPHTCWGIAPPRPCTCRPESVVKAEALREAAKWFQGQDVSYRDLIAADALLDRAYSLERDPA